MENTTNTSKLNNIKLFIALDIVINVLVIILFALMSYMITREISIINILLDLLFLSVIFIAINSINHPKRYIFKIIIYTFLLFTVYADITSYNWYSQVFRYYEISNVPILIRTFRIGFKVSISAIVITLSAIAFVVFYAKVQKINRDRKYNIKITNKPKKAMLVLSTIPFIYTLSFIFIVSTYDYDYNYSDTFLVKELYSNEEYISEYGYSQYRIRKLFPKIKSSTNYMEELDEYYNRSYTKATNEYSSQYEDYNIISIQVETLDTRLINEYTMPNLYSLYNESIVVNDYFVPEYQQGATCNSEFMALTSMYPLSGNDTTNIVCKVVHKDYEFSYSLPRQLSSLGYNTHYIHNGTEGFYNRDTIIPNAYGFNNSYFTNDNGNTIGTPSDGYSDSAMLEFMDEVNFDELFYLNFLTFSIHVGDIDYTSEQEAYIQEHLGPLTDTFLIDYYKEQMDTDAFIGELIDLLKEKNVYDNTLIYIYSDHYPYGADGTAFDYLDAIGVEYTSNHEVHRMSLIIHDGGNTVEEYTIPSSTVDITPTILNMVSNPSQIDYRYYFGNDIFDELSVVSFSNYDIYIEDTFFGFTSTYISDIVNQTHLDNYRLRNMNDFAIKIRHKSVIK